MISTKKRQRRGNVVVLSAILMGVMMAMVAFSVDLGSLYVVQAELQKSADASALAGAAELYPMPVGTGVSSFRMSPQPDYAVGEARRFAALNGAGKYRSNLDFKLEQGDMSIGRLYVPTDRSSNLVPTWDFPNAVQVTTRLQEGHANGPVPLYFAKALGFVNSDVVATATAIVRNPSLLPFATSEGKWASLENGGNGDNYAFRNGQVIAGEGDNVPEIIIYPDSKWSDGDGLPPGNFGALDIGPKSGTDILRAQIDMGPTHAEMSYHGGSGKWNSGIKIPGKTGINGDVKSALSGGNADGRSYAGIEGLPRYLPIYEDVSGNGSNAQFTITGFGAVRVVDSNMKGGNKWVALQPITDVNHVLTVHLVR